MKNLSNDPTKSDFKHYDITPDQVAHQLLLNGKTTNRISKTKLERDMENENNFLGDNFTVDEVYEAISQMKNNKAAGIDDLRTEQIKHFGIET